MKSILSTLIFVLVFFLSFFLFPFLQPSPALAKTCCDIGTPIDTQFCGNLPTYLTVSKIQNNCDASTKCNPSSNTCIASTATATKNPTCPQDHSYQQGSQCCIYVTSSVGPVDCQDNIMTYCGGDSLWKYNSDKKICEQLAESIWILQNTCDNNHPGVQTAIGCVPTGDLKGFLEFVLKWAFFTSGGIIVLMVIATGYTLMTSQGNPEKLQAAKENIVALFSGLILIAFSLVLLQTIGADVLKLPTF